MANQEALYKLLQECTVRLSSSSGSGTGFFVAPGGWILTCNHVVEQSTRVKVLWLSGENRQEFTAIVQLRVVEPIDVALLKIEGNAPNHKCVYLEQSLPQVGDTLYIFGYPQDYGTETYSGGDSVTTKYEGESFQDDVLVLKLKEGQIQEGYSGSPLLNMRTSKVCGIVSISRNTTSDLGGRATPISSLLKSKKDITEMQVVQRLILSMLENNKKFHQDTDKTWNKIVRQSFLDRKLALIFAIVSLACFALAYLNSTANPLTLAVLKFLVSCGFGYSALLFVGSLNLKSAAARNLPVRSLTGFLTTIFVFIISFLIIPETNIILRNLTGINEYPTLGLIEKNLPLSLKKVLDINGEPIVDTKNPVYEAIQAFRDESGNASLMSRYEKPSGLSSAFNQGNSTIRKTLVTQNSREEGKQEKIRQDLKDFESEPRRFEGEHQEFIYTDKVLLPFQTSLEDAEWAAFIPLSADQERYKGLEAGSLIQYPKLSSVRMLGSFASSSDKNTWIKKILDSNPEVRGFLAFIHKYAINITARSNYISSFLFNSLFDFLFECGYIGIESIAPTPYVRFVDIHNNSLFSIKIDSVKVKTVEKDKYKLTPIVPDRDIIFQDIPAKDESLSISIYPGSHLFIPTEFGFDTRLSKNNRRWDYVDVSTGKDVGNKTELVNLIDRSLYLAKIPLISRNGSITLPSSTNDIVKQFLNPTSFTKDFIDKTKSLPSLSESVPNRFAVGSLRNVISIRIDGKDVQVDNPLNDPRFSMSAYFAYGSCPYLMVYDSQKGYWIELGTVITGQQTKAQKNYEIHKLGDHPSKLRIEERDKEITYLDSISILYTDMQSGEEKEVSSQIPELAAVDESYFILHQNDSLEVNLKKLLPRTAVNVRLKVNGYYEVLPGVMERQAGVFFQ